MAEQRDFSKVQLSKLTNKKDLHLLIQGKVYDVHHFVNEHPGGDLVLLGEAGQDATKAWEDVQHSDEAKEMMNDYLVGYCSEALSRPKNQARNMVEGKQTKTPSVNHLKTTLLAIPLILCLALLLRRYSEG